MFSNDFKFTEGEAASFSVVFQVIRSVNFVNLKSVFTSLVLSTCYVKKSLLFVDDISGEGG